MSAQNDDDQESTNPTLIGRNDESPDIPPDWLSGSAEVDAVRCSSGCFRPACCFEIGHLSFSYLDSVRLLTSSTPSRRVLVPPCKCEQAIFRGGDDQGREPLSHSAPVRA